ncbi:MAG TPA: hypothetical protein VNX68_01830 [Nitrosopumilaceae archaeon]|jgi:hypothetical protein|nr:hypothetical protein [Nitrosopumilaceae archaeon]
MSEPAKYTNQQYKFICELIWGGTPVDKSWAQGTKLFIAEAPKILEKYPMLDKSFFEQNKQHDYINKSQQT